MKFAFIAVEKASAPVSVLCKVLDVSRSGYSAWEQRVPSAHSLDDAKLRVHIAAIYERSRGLYGAPRVHAELRAAGLCVGRKRVARLMVELGLASRPRLLSRCFSSNDSVARSSTGRGRRSPPLET